MRRNQNQDFFGLNHADGREQPSKPSQRARYTGENLPIAVNGDLMDKNRRWWHDGRCFARIFARIYGILRIFLGWCMVGEVCWQIYHRNLAQCLGNMYLPWMPKIAPWISMVHLPRSIFNLCWYIYFYITEWFVGVLAELEWLRVMKMGMLVSMGLWRSGKTCWLPFKMETV